jgi:hypothetical protein
LPAWRRARLAYGEMRQAGATDQEAHDAAVAAVQTVLPPSWNEASVEAVNAIAYATRYLRSVLEGRAAHRRSRKLRYQPERWKSGGRPAEPVLR